MVGRPYSRSYSPQSLEIGGAYLVGQGIREGKGPWLASSEGSLSRPTASWRPSSRIISSAEWRRSARGGLSALGDPFDGFRPDRYDVVGAAAIWWA